MSIFINIQKKTMKNLLNEIKAMNKIAGTELTKEQEIALIKQRLNEAAGKIKVPSGFSVVHMSGKRYTFEYQKSGFEPTIQQASQAADNVTKEFNKVKDQLQAGAPGKVTIYKREDDIAIGLDFISKLDYDAMDELFTYGISSRDDY